LLQATTILKATAFEQITGIQHAFFTRQGGVSTGVHSSLNCCYRGKDDPANVRENRQRVMSYLGISFESLITTINVHGNNVISVDVPWEESNPPEADGMVTNLKNIVLASDSADCPIVLFADNTSEVIGLAHAGWKSSFAGILEKTMDIMLSLGAKPHQMSAVIGPCILQPSYEVSTEFYDNFIAHSSLNESFFIPSNNESHKLFDLLGFVREKLKNLNLQNISEIGLDTYMKEDLFFSCRRAMHRKENDFGGHFSCIYMSNQK
jgi:YfiH family protein